MNLPKIDWTINESNSFSISYNRMRWKSPNGIQTQAVNQRGRASFGDDFVEVDSPDRNYTAISYSRGCGVTSSDYSHIEIRWNWLGGIISKEVAEFDGGKSTELYWKNDDELVIKTSMIPKQTENYKPFGISVIVKKED